MFRSMFLHIEILEQPELLIRLMELLLYVFTSRPVTRIENQALRREGREHGREREGFCCSNRGMRVSGLLDLLDSCIYAKFR